MGIGSECMLDKIFIEIVNMSYIGSIVIVAILVLRVFLKKAPKKFSYMLWAIPLFRLLIPFSFESVFSLIPVNSKPIPVDIGYLVSPQINTNVTSVDYSMNNLLPEPEVVSSVNPVQIAISIGAMIWLVIMMGLIIYGISSYFKMKKQLVNAVFVEDNVYSSSNINTPFVIGITKPKIYLPESVLESEKEYILLHEESHIKRLDHIFRLIGYFVLCIHWFNPLVWMAYYVYGKDMEMSCDELVISKLGEKVKKEYSQSLLNFTTKTGKLSMSPLAFGEGDTKGRIKNVLNFHKPKIYIVIVATVALIILSIGLLANPVGKSTIPSFINNTYNVDEILFSSPMYSFDYTVESAPSFTISPDYVLFTKEGEYDWERVGGLFETEIKKEELLTWIHFEEFLDEKAVNFIDEAKAIYRAETNNENNLFYLVLETEDHQVLILYGYGTEADASIRWIFEVERMVPIDISLSVSEIWNYRTEFIGNNSAVGNIASQLQYSEFMEYNGISLQTEKQPYGLTIMLQLKDDVEVAIADENSEILKRINACIMFSLVQNLDEVAFSVESNTIKSNPYIYTRTWAENFIGIDLWEASESEDAFDELLVKIKDMVSSYSNVPIDTHITSNENSLEQAISEAILDYNTQHGIIGGTPFESHVIFEVEEDETNDETLVYALVLNLALSANESGIQTHSGWHVPCRIRFKNGLNNTYEFIEYWVPRDGSYYATDIRDAFPDEVEDEAIDTQKYITMQVQSIYSRAINTFNIDTDKVINGLLEVIMSSPMQSSNPGDYIEAHRIEYRELIYYGDYMAAFIERELEEGNTGLRSKILEIIYEDMNK